MKKTYKPGELFEKNRSTMEKKHRKGSMAALATMPTKGSYPFRTANSTSPVGGKKFFPKKHKKNWIQNAIKKPGALRSELGVKSGNKIPAGKLAAAAKKGGKEGKRARLAQTLKSFHKTKKTEKKEKTGLKFGSPEWRAKYMGKKKDTKTHKKTKKVMCKTHKKVMCKVCAKKHEKKN